MKEITGKMDLLAKAYYVLGYCSPKRNGVHEVTVELKVSRKSRVSSKFDAAGFGPGCDADKIDNPCSVLQCGQYGSTDCGNCTPGSFCENYTCLPNSVLEERERQVRLAQERLDKVYNDCKRKAEHLMALWRKYEADKCADNDKDCGRRVGARMGASLLSLDGVASVFSFGQAVLPFVEVHGGVGFPGSVVLVDLRFLLLASGALEVMLTPRFGYALANDGFTGEVDALVGVRFKLSRLYRLVAEGGVGYSWGGDEAYLDNQSIFFPVWAGAEITW